MGFTSNSIEDREVQAQEIIMMIIVIIKIV